MIPSKDELLPYRESRKEAAKKFGVTEKTIINWLKKYNLYQPKPNYGCGKLDGKRATEIRKLHSEGASIKELSKKYDVTFATISRIIHNLIYREEKGTAIVNVVYNLHITNSTGENKE
jgi:transposase